MKLPNILLESRGRIFRLAFIFLLLIPFRLPVGVLIIHLISNISHMAGDVGDGLVAGNITLTKMIYNVAIASIFIYNVEMGLRDWLDDRFGNTYRDDQWDHGDSQLHLITIGLILFFIAYIIIDGVNTNNLYYQLYTQQSQ
jgi:hypothetical protein